MSTLPLPDGFEALYTEHYDFLWRCALRLGAPPANVEDVVQEAFVVALRRYDRAGFEGPDAARVSTWLFAILHNVLRNHARSEQRRRARLELIAVDQPTRSPMHADTSLGLRLLDEFLTELEPDRRAVFVLSELEGMRGPEIAQALGVNANTIRSRLRAARHAFEDRFGDGREQLVTRASEVEAPREAAARGLALLGPSLVGMPLASVTPGAAIGSLGVFGMVMGSIVLVGAILIVSGSSRGQPASTTEPPTKTIAESSVVREPASTAEPIEPEPPIIVEALEPRAVQRSASNPVNPVNPVDLEALARERLARARRALLDGDATTALSLVEASDAWPAKLDAHRVALEIGALCTLDRPQQARARAQTWEATHPEPASAIPMQAACWDDNSSTVDGH